MDSNRLIAITGSVAIHLLVLGVVLFTLLDEPETPPEVVSVPIQARAVDEATAMAAVRQREERERRAAEKKRQAELERQRLVEQKRQQAEAERQRQAEIKRKKLEAARAHKEELKRKRAEAEKQRKLEEERRRQSELERKKLEDEQRLKKAVERKKLEQQQRKEAEVKRKEEAERQRLAAEQKLREQAMLQQMEAEAEVLAAEQARYQERERRLRQQRLSSENKRYIGEIAEKVKRNWLRPPGSTGTECRVVINQIPSGEIINVKVMGCDGDLSFEGSVERAVRRASPLPLPSEQELFQREIEFVFRP